MRIAKIAAIGRALVFATVLLPVPAPAAAGGALRVVTANYPLQYFAARIAGDLAQVEYLMPADADPARWSPDEATLLRFHEADLILLNGAGYEKWIETASLPLNRLIDTTHSLSSQFIHSGEVVTHAHGPSGKHSHESLASMTWLDLSLAAEQARGVAEALTERLPEHAEALSANLASLIADLESMDRELVAIAGLSGRPALLTSHPVYQYFGRRYGFALSTVHWEPADYPPASDWQHLAVLLEQNPAEWMLWEAPPLPEVRAGLMRLGIEPVVFRTLESAPDEGDFMSVMRANIDALRRIAQ